MALPDPRFSTPRVLGVDDFAIRRRQTYSTVSTSAEDRCVVDVLPTREAGPLVVANPRALIGGGSRRAHAALESTVRQG
ncbi:hypothetical protein K7B06_00510 [Streptomyces erythrochromogenes]|nr:hypothetical protein [Streptomyces erythrochromogenes]